MNLFDALKRYSTIVADTGDFEAIAAFKPQGATTTPFLLVCAFIATAVVMAVAPTDAYAQKKKVDIGKKWDGSVDDEKAIKPECITSPTGLEAVWKAWKIAGDMPKVDFTKDMVVAVYTVGSKLNLGGANLDEQGNLDVLGFGTRDIRPGFRYALGVVSREGVKTVNKKALPEQ